MIRSASPWLAAALTLLLSLSALADDARKAGDEAFANKKWPEAIVAYEKLSADDKIGDVTYRLAYSEHNLGKFKEAQAHYERAFKLGFRVPGGFYNLACAQARNAQPDAAFESLNKVIQASFVTSDQMVADDDLVSLHKDARWEPLVAKLRLAEHPCETPNHHGFDFWVGNWVVKNPAGVIIGQSHVDRILNGCVLLENWTDAAKHEGKSFNRYEPKLKQWRQTWVDQQGSQTDYVGSFEGESLVFIASGEDAQGKPQLTRMTFSKQGPPEPEHEGRRMVRQFFETSSDAGKTWTAGFDGRYFPM